MSDFLGKKVVPEPVEPGEDEYERKDTPHGPIWRNKRTGYLHSHKPEPPPPPLEQVETDAIDFIVTVMKALRKQKEDGFPPIHWGVM